jgi:hypothetical protein
MDTRKLTQAPMAASTVVFKTSPELIVKANERIVPDAVPINVLG